MFNDLPYWYDLTTSSLRYANGLGGFQEAWQIPLRPFILELVFPLFPHMSRGLRVFKAIRIVLNPLRMVGAARHQSFTKRENHPFREASI